MSAAIENWAKVVDTAWHAMSGEKKPVIIVAGTLQPAATYDRLADRLRAEGYDVRIFELPNLGRGDIALSADALAAFTDRVRQETGSDKVDLVAHSQGGLVARQYVKFDGGADHVDNLISMGSPNHGTVAAWAVTLIGADKDGFVAGEQMSPGSDFLARLNEGDDTIGDVRYTSFYTDHDAVVFPATTARLADGATNVRIQDQLPDNPVGHNGMPFDPAVQNGILDALRGEPVDLTR
jgi:triacylglycerol esterase/lipase EstA (alpha/beta hydrolase family)